MTMLGDSQHLICYGEEAKVVTSAKPLLKFSIGERFFPFIKLDGDSYLLDCYWDFRSYANLFGDMIKGKIATIDGKMVGKVKQVELVPHGSKHTLRLNIVNV